jgi:RNA-binding protein
LYSLILQVFVKTFFLPIEGDCGRSGLSGQLTASVDTAINDPELIKVKFLEFKEDKKEMAGETAGATKSEVVGIIGNIAIFYRQHRLPQLREIKI